MPELLRDPKWKSDLACMLNEISATSGDLLVSRREIINDATTTPQIASRCGPEPFPLAINYREPLGGFYPSVDNVVNEL